MNLTFSKLFYLIFKIAPFMVIVLKVEALNMIARITRMKYIDIDWHIIKGSFAHIPIDKEKYITNVK